MKKHLTLFFTAFLLGHAEAQQLPLFTQYRENHALINPGSVSPNFINFERPWSVGMSIRSQWIGVEGSPRTQNVQLEHIFANPGASLIAGGHIINDQAGRVGFTGIYGRIGGIISEDPRDYGFAAGITLGVVQYRVNAVGVNAVNPEDPFLRENRQKIFPDVGLGGVYYKKIGHGRDAVDLFYAGLSIPQVLGLDTRFRSDNGAKNLYGIKRTQHYYGELGYRRALNDDYSYIEPSMWVKWVAGGPLHFDWMLRYQFSNAFYLGAGASTAKFFHAEAGFYVGQNLGLESDLKVGFGFDAPLQRYGGVYSKAFEVNVSYAFGEIR